MSNHDTDSQQPLLKRLQNFFAEYLWREDLLQLPVWRRFGYRTLQFGWVLRRDLLSGDLNLRAMSLVYTTLLSLVPLLAVSFSMLKAFGVHNQVEPMLLNFVTPMGDMGVEIINKTMEFVDRIKVGVLGAVGLTFLLYTVISLIQKIENAFNYVWHIERSRTLARRFSDYLSVVMVGPVLVFSAMGITASVANNNLVTTLSQMEPFGSMLLLLGKFIPYLFICFAFFFVYIFVPNTKVRIKSALVGACVAGILWETTGMLFARFVANSANYAAIYSGFAILVVFMIWLYAGWLILLIGAQIAYYHQYPHQIRKHPAVQLPRGRHYRALMTQIMLLIVQRFKQGEPAADVQHIAEQMQLPPDVTTLLLQKLESHLFIQQTCEEHQTYLPATDPDSLTLWRFLQTIDRGSYKNHQLNDTRIDTLFSQIDDHNQTLLQQYTFVDLLQQRATIEESALPA